MMNEYSRITVMTNGYNVQYVNTKEEVEQIIKERLAPNMGLQPKVVMDRTLKTKIRGKDAKTRILRYRYRTLYEEVFIIEYEFNN